ncbi:hypothetical protein GIB67_011339 [Kingdonia uniflora]|uniref:EF-hand domain-containing protein n=1 Tax=Kingdonia uniflora TaxID=39325 RepID=A0A7J7MDQ2_9MAGN|nr:hypothetical protein GIB67_011339 [Kingdonia uniflora]
MCPSKTQFPESTMTMSDIQSAFQILDIDHDGKISKDDLQTFYTWFTNASEDDIGSMISVADSNKDGYVEFHEFEKVVKTTTVSSTVDWVMEDMFKVMDGDGDGKVGVEDLRRYLSLAGICVNEEDIKVMIKLGGGDEKGGVCYDGFLKILAVNFA